MTRGVADGRCRLRWRVRVRGVRRESVVAGRVRAGVKAEIGEFGIAAVGEVVVAEIFQVNEPLRPEPPADPLAVHGQVDQLSWGKIETQKCSFFCPYKKMYCWC